MQDLECHHMCQNRWCCNTRHILPLTTPEHSELHGHLKKWILANKNLRGEDHPNYGRRQTEEAKKKMSRSKKGKKLNLTDEQRQAKRDASLGENNNFWGKKHTIKSRKSMSKNKKGKNKGEKHPNAVFTQQQADAIRKEYLQGGITYQKLSEKYGVGKSTIARVINNKNYQTLQNDETRAQTKKVKKQNNIATGAHARRAIFTQQQADAIRKEYAQGGVKVKDLAEKHNVHRVTIGKIIRKETYI